MTHNDSGGRVRSRNRVVIRCGRLLSPRLVNLSCIFIRRHYAELDPVDTVCWQIRRQGKDIDRRPVHTRSVVRFCRACRLG